MVGPTEMVDKAVEDHVAKTHPLRHVESESISTFLGFEEVFGTFDLSPKWIVEFRTNQEIEKILQLKPRERFEQAVDLYSAAVSRIASQEVKPDIVFAVFESMVRVCWSISRDLSNPSGRPFRKQDPAWARCFARMDDFEETTEDLLYRDFRHAEGPGDEGKMPIQIAREALLVDSKKRKMRLQEPGT